MPYRCDRCGRELDDQFAVQNDFLCARRCGGTLVLVLPAGPGDLGRLPSVLAIPLHEFAVETHPVLRLHRLCDAVEILTRFGTMVALGEVRGRLGEAPLPAELIRKVRQQIERPTFGQWRDLLQALLGALRRSDPLVVPELPDFVDRHLLPRLQGGEASPQTSLLALRNDLAHGGAMTRAAAQEFLGVWDPWIQQLMQELAFLADVEVCWFAHEAARRLTGPRGSLGGERSLSADLRLALRPLDGHVVLLRQQRWLDLWPLCDYGRAVAHTPQGRHTATADSPLVYIRAQRERLLYAALGAELPQGERTDGVQQFRDLFQLAQRAASPGQPPDFEEEIRADAAAMQGRIRELEQIKRQLQTAERGVFWVSGRGGLGKSYLLAKVADDLGNAPATCRIAWRFKLSDGVRCQRDAFFRHALDRLGRWLGRTDLPFTVDPTEQLRQLTQLLEAVPDRPAGKEGKRPRVLFVLDGLDEIERLDPEFPGLPLELDRPGVVWLCAGRPEGTLPQIFAPGRCTHVFPERDYHGQRLEGLPPMSDADIRGLLLDNTGKLKYDLLKLDEEDKAGEGPVNAAVAAVVARAAGLPVFVRFVVEDILAGELRFAELADKLPRSLNAYYDAMLRRLAIGELQALLTPLVVTLAWAQGPLDEETLLWLLAWRTAAEQTEAGRLLLRRGLEAVQAMVRLAPTSAGGMGYEPYHLTFREHIRRDEEHLIGTQNPQSQKAFCALARAWRELPAGHPARHYALRHGPRHLMEAGPEQHPALFALARDDEYLQAQAAAFADHPDAPLTVLRFAVEAAGARDDAAGMVEFCLRHARRRQETTRESPLQALAHSSLTRAWRLVDLAEPRERVLWYLLLLWALQEGGRAEDGQETVRRLLQQECPRLDGWHAEHADLILKEIAGDDPERWSELRQRLLSEKSAAPAPSDRAEASGPAAPAAPAAAPATPTEASPRDALIEAAKAQTRAGHAAEARQMVLGLEDEDDLTWALWELALAQAEAGQAQDARQTAGGIPDEEQRADMLTRVAKTQAGQPAEARQTLADACQAALCIHYEDSRGWALIEVATIQREIGHGEDAHRTALGIPIPEWRVDALLDVARAQVQAGQTQGARRTLGDAYQSALPIEEPGERAAKLARVTQFQAQAGQMEEARQTLTDIRQTIPLCENEDSRGEAYKALWEAQAATLQLEEARQTALDMAEGERREEALAHVVELLAAAGRIEDAQRLAYTMQSGGPQSRALKAVCEEQTRRAVAWVRAGRTAEAREMVDSIRYTLGGQDRLDAVTMVLEAQVATGQIQEARQTALGVWYKEGCARLLAQVAQVQVKAGQTEEARHILADAYQAVFSSQDGEAAAGALAAVAEAQAAAGQTQEARQTALCITNPQQRIGALLGVARIQSGPEARQTFAKAYDAATELTKNGKRVSEMARVAKAQAAQARAGLEQKDSQAKPGTQDEEGRAWALAEVAEALVHVARAQAFAGQIEEACRTALAVGDEKKRDSALTLVAIDLAMAGRAQQACQTALRVKDEKDRDFALTEVAKELTQIGQVPQAYQSILNIREEWWRDCCWEELALAQVQVGQIAEAHETVLRIQDEQTRTEALAKVAEAEDAQEEPAEPYVPAEFGIPDNKVRETALIAVAEAQAEVARTQAAAGQIAEAHETALRIQVDEQRAKVLSEVAGIEAGTGQTQNARQTFAEAVQTALRIPDEYNRTRALEELALAQRAAKQHQEARQTVLRIPRKGDCSRALVDLTWHQANYGEVQEARETALCIQEEDYRARALCDVAWAQAKAGQTQEARQTLAEAFHTALRIPEEQRRDQLLLEVAMYQAKAGQIPEAQETVLRIQSERRRAEAQVVVAPAQVQVGQTAEAQETALRIQDQAQRAKALTEVAPVQAQAGQAQNARQTALRRVGEWDRAEALATEAKVQAEAGNGEQAVATALTILINREEHLLKLAQILAQRGERAPFKRLLLACAHDHDATCRLAGLVARLYPQQATAIARLLREDLGVDAEPAPAGTQPT